MHAHGNTIYCRFTKWTQGFFLKKKRLWFEANKALQIAMCKFLWASFHTITHKNLLKMGKQWTQPLIQHHKIIWERACYWLLGYFPQDLIVSTMKISKYTISACVAAYKYFCYKFSTWLTIMGNDSVFFLFLKNLYNCRIVGAQESDAWKPFPMLKGRQPSTDATCPPVRKSATTTTNTS